MKLMKLDGIKSLYKSMREKKIDRYKFDFLFNGKRFDVLYFIDEEPHKLAVGIKSHNFYFEKEVKIGYKIKPFFDEGDYSKFCEIMGFKFDEKSPFSPSIFFKELNASVPEVAYKNKIPKPHEVAEFRKDVEESEKIFFVGWLDNRIRGRKVSEDNLKKTRRLLSEQAYLMCKEMNISSRWSDKRSDAKEFSEKELAENYK